MSSWPYLTAFLEKGCCYTQAAQTLNTSFWLCRTGVFTELERLGEQHDLLFKPVPLRQFRAQASRIKSLIHD